MACSS
jgi:hypothetical protein